MERKNQVHVQVKVTNLPEIDDKRLQSTLVEAGNTVVMVEHNMQVAGACDHIIDMGPGAGDEGGKIVAEGRPEEVAKVQQSATAPFLKASLA